MTSFSTSLQVIVILMRILWSFVNVFMMGNLSNEDKMRIPTLHEQGLGAKAIRASYPDKNWSLSTLQTICRRVDEMGSVVTRRAGRGTPRSARTTEKIAEVGELNINITTTCSDVENDVIFQRILNM